MTVSSPHDVLDHVFDSFTDSLTPEIARKILDIHFDPQAQAQIDDLAVKANEGLLTPQERDQYEGFIEAIDLLGIFQAKARLVLSQSR